MEKEIVTPVEAIIEKEVTANEMKKNEKGITLIALIITIIILLILAGITIALLTGENGILKRVATAREINDISKYKEKIYNIRKKRG